MHDSFDAYDELSPKNWRSCNFDFCSFYKQRVLGTQIILYLKKLAYLVLLTTQNVVFMQDGQRTGIERKLCPFGESFEWSSSCRRNDSQVFHQRKLLYHWKLSCTRSANCCKNTLLRQWESSNALPA